MEESIVELRSVTIGGELWLEIWANRELYRRLGPFDTASERKATLDHLLKGVLSLPGAEVITPATQ